MFKVNNRSTWKKYETCSKLKIKTLEFLFLLWTFFTPFSKVSIVDSEHVNISCETSFIWFSKA